MSSTNNAAWLKEAGKPLVVESAPFPEPGANEIVVEARAVSINPMDYAMASTGRMVRQYPTVLGHDVAGIVAAVGPGVTGFSVGDRVMADGRALMMGKAAYGCFQSYTVIPLPTAMKIPDGISDPEAVVLPVPVDAASACLFQESHLGLALPPTDAGRGKTVLIWGASSAVGCSATQLAVAAGYDVVATAGQRNHDLVRSLGAAAVFDYRSPTIVEELTEALRGKEVVGAVACARGKDVHEALCRVLAKTEGARRFVSSVDPAAKDFAVEDAVCSSVFASTVATNQVGPHIWTKFLPDALASGKFVCKPTPVVAGRGLEAFQAALDLYAKGVSARKIVVEL